ncbi:hypothetical protein GCM10027174_43470 [Salinifilum aidingensis]
MPDGAPRTATPTGVAIQLARVHAGLDEEHRACSDDRSRAQTEGARNGVLLALRLLASVPGVPDLTEEHRSGETLTHGTSAAPPFPRQ